MDGVRRKATYPRCGILSIETTHVASGVRRMNEGIASSPAVPAETSGDVLSGIRRSVAQRLLDQAVEAEVQACLESPSHIVDENGHLLVVGNGSNVREFVYIDAHKGAIVDQITGIHDAIDRIVYDQFVDPGNILWQEGDTLPFGDAEVDNIIEYSEDIYNLIASATNGTFLSWDNADGQMPAIHDDNDITCPNAHWTGSHVGFCIGSTSDNTVAHEWTHAYTQSTHGLIYQWQPGALNESYSDIFSEVVDLLNGSGTDTPDVVRTPGDCSVFGGSIPPTFTVDSPPAIAGQYPAGGAAFNPVPPLTVSADVELVNDGTASVTDGCESLIGFTAGNIALIDRGTCAFTQKVLNAAAAGAVGVIIANTDDSIFTMSGTGPLAIPSAIIRQSAGADIKAELPGVSATITLQTGTANSVRWLYPEDGAGGVYRDLWNPNCKGHPGKVSDTAQYWCTESDQGGVHTNSGVPNHGFALLVDGGTYNGQTIAGRRENRVPILRHEWRSQRRQFELHRHRLPIGPSSGRLQR